MATYNTSNPIGSTDSRDRLDNTENMDYLENSTTELTHPDRLGTVRKTRHGMEAEHDAQISAHEVEHDAQIAAHEVEHDNQMQSFETDFDGRLAGMAFTRVGSFTTGATLTDMRQVLVWEASQGGDGHEYGWTGSFSPSGKVVIAGSNPKTTGGIGAGAWVDRTDLMLRSEVDKIAVARSLNVINDKVIYSSDTVTALDDFIYIYDFASYIVWGKPVDVGVGETIVSISGHTLTTSGGVYDLVQIAYPKPLAGDDIGPYAGKYVYDSSGKKYYIPTYMADGSVFPASATLDTDISSGLISVNSGTSAVIFSEFESSIESGIPAISICAGNGYILASENAEQVINTAARNGICIICPDEEVLISSTIIIPSNGITLSSKTGAFSGASVKAGASMTAADLIVDTDNYSYLYTNRVKVTDPTNPLDIASPKVITIKGVVFKGLYDASVLASPIAGEGIGVRLYGGCMQLDLKVVDVYNVGVLTYYPFTDGGVVAGTNDSINTVESNISVATGNTGREGFVFDGPADAALGTVRACAAASSDYGLESVTLVDSLEYPGDTEKLCPAIYINKSCHHTGYMNGYGTRNGWSIVIDDVRFDSSGQVQIDSSDGGLLTTANSRAQFANIELHGFTYGFILHNGAYRPAIRNKSVEGFICKNIKGAIGGNWNNRPIFETVGVGTDINLSISPIYSDAPSNVGILCNVTGRQHNIHLNTSGTLPGARAFYLEDLLYSNISGEVHYMSNNVIDMTNLDGGRDKGNKINVTGVILSANSTLAIEGLSTLTPKDLKDTKISLYSNGALRSYMTNSFGISSPVVITDVNTSVVFNHNYFGAPNVNDIVIDFRPTSTTDIMPTISGVRITNITNYSVTVAFTMSGGTGALYVISNIN